MPPGLGKAVGDPDNDDYVAQVLAQEARDSSLRYSALGLEAYIPRRPTGSAPKPNTRFLRHIIKETDNHNAALKRKEEKEARERMRQLRGQAPSSSHNSSNDKDKGKERDEDRRHRRSHRSDDRDRRKERTDREDRHRSHRSRRRSRSASTDRERPRTSRRRHDSRDRDEDRYRHSRRSRRHRSYSRSRSRSRSPQNDRELDSRSRHRRYRRRSGSPRSRSRSRESRGKRTDREHAPRERRLSPSPTLGNRNDASGDESDPLEDLVGPLPPKEDAPIRSRGRGAYKPNTSNIDAHFAPDYDPTLDVQPEDDDLGGTRSTRRPVPGLMTADDDWELALEALRDRARWKQKGEERLREAGFNSDVVERWKNSASADSEGRLDSVRWSTKSEGREWDRGKFIDEDGHVDVKATW